MISLTITYYYFILLIIGLVNKTTVFEHYGEYAKM